MEPFQTLPEGVRRYLPAARVVRDALVQELVTNDEKTRRIVEEFTKERIGKLGVDGEILLPLVQQASDEDPLARHETMLMIAGLAVVIGEVDDTTLEIGDK